MSPITVGDCLCTRLMRVHADQRYSDVVKNGERAQVFAVFDEPRYLGLVTEKQAALFPGRIFADLVQVLRQFAPLEASLPLEVCLTRMQEGKEEFIPVADAAGDLAGVISRLSLFMGLSEAERRLRQEREVLIQRLEEEVGHHRMAAAVFEATSEGILITDAENRIVLVNRAFTDTTGYPLEEVRGRTPAMLSSGRHNRLFYDAMWEAVRASGGWSGEIWNRRKNGEIYPEWLHINVIRDADGEVVHHVGIFSDITLHKDVQRRLHSLAYYDPLTELPNRQLFLDRLEQAITHAQRDNAGFSLLFIDLDRFKDVNDSLGHAFGDKLLMDAASRIRDAVRASDTVARLGGDEFTVILEDEVTPEDAAGIARKIIKSFARPMQIDGRNLFVGASVGIARFPSDGDCSDALLKSADTAMYQAKEKGRGRYCFFTQDLNRRVTERLDMENALRTGLSAGDIHPVWQPQVRLTDGKMIGMEALARWHDAALGEVPPARFIPIAEEGGMILELSRQVLEQAALDIVDVLRQRPDVPLRFAVNLSAQQVRQDQAMEDILGVLTRHGIPPNRLELELTESALMGREHSAEEFLKSLGASGVQFAVDDFGTGYSNLAYLKRFAVQRLKIDKSFVQDLAEADNSRQIVTAIIGLAHSMGLSVIAEGVETEAQRDILQELGCDEAQGYLFGRPMALDELLRTPAL
ncbi:MAG: EAL domain-containing protein [Betaproteobacteria bacterium]|nr:EAL domain-containing protein [Betaproteobacteria bacterium]